MSNIPITRWKLGPDSHGPSLTLGLYEFEALLQQPVQDSRSSRTCFLWDLPAINLWSPGQSGWPSQHTFYACSTIVIGNQITRSEELDLKQSLLLEKQISGQSSGHTFGQSPLFSLVTKKSF